jgi:hypothetical protein
VGWHKETRIADVCDTTILYLFWLFILRVTSIANIAHAKQDVLPGGANLLEIPIGFCRRCAMMCMSISICHHNHCSLLQPIIMKPNPNQLLLRDLIIILLVHFIDHATCG